MAALSEDFNTATRRPSPGFLPVAAATVLFGLSLVCRNASGYAVPASDSGSLFIVGIARDRYDNTDGAAGDIHAEFLTDEEILLDYTGDALTQADIGRRVFVVDDHTVGPTGNCFVGTITGVESASSCWVRLKPELDADLIPFAAGGFEGTSVEDALLDIRASQLFCVRIAGTNATALDLSTAAALYGGSDFTVQAVVAVEAFLTADKSSVGMRVAADYTVAAGDITPAGDESANTLHIWFLGQLTFA